MKDLEHAMELLQKARNDFKAITGMENADLFSDEIFGFHAQQCIEKGLKAWLATLAILYPKTHDIGVLLEILEEHGQEVEPLWFTVELNDFAVIFRYSSTATWSPAISRQKTLHEIKEALEWIENKIKEHHVTNH